MPSDVCSCKCKILFCSGDLLFYVLKMFFSILEKNSQKKEETCKNDHKCHFKIIPTEGRRESNLSEWKTTIWQVYWVHMKLNRGLLKAFSFFSILLCSIMLLASYFFLAWIFKIKGLKKGLRCLSGYPLDLSSDMGLHMGIFIEKKN